MAKPQKKKNGKLVAKGFPGSEKILSDFKKSGPNLKGIKKPVTDKRFTTLVEKKSQRAINSYTDMNKSKFDQLFESVVQDKDLGGLEGLDDLEGQLDTDASDLGSDETDASLDATSDVGEERDLHTLLADLTSLVAEITSKIEEENGGADDVLDDMDGDLGDGGDLDSTGDADSDFEKEMVKEEEVDAENLGTPLVNQKKNPLHDPKGSNKVDAPGNKPTGGKANSGKISNVSPNPEAVADSDGQSLTDKKKNKPNSNIKGGQSLFHV